MRRLLAVVAILASFAAVSTVQATGCRTHVVRVNKVVENKVVKEVVKEFVPVALPVAYPVVAVPVYSYVNAPGYAPPIASDSADRIADIVIKRLEAKFGAKGNGGDGPPAVRGGTNTAGDAVKILTNRCASCHSGQATTGGGLSFFEANRTIKAINREVRWDILDAVYEGRMPKGSPALSDEEVDAIRQWARQR